MLKYFEALLQSLSFETHLIVASETAPMDQLVVLLAPDEKGRERSLWLTPLPHLDQDLEEGLSLLQFFTTLPAQYVAETEIALEKLILQLNNTLPLGGFGLGQTEGVIYYRYVLMLGPDEATGGKIVGEVVMLINYLLDQFSNPIEDATRG
jgi:hypothetical protein